MTRGGPMKTGAAALLLGVLFALLTGGVASLLPALRGSRVEPVDVLRGQVG